MRSIDRGCVTAIEAPAAARRHVQAPGFARVRVGDLLVTALYDGFVAILADDFRGEPTAEVSRWLAEAFMPPDGDRRTAVIAFLVEDHGRRILIDSGSGDSLGPDTGYLPRNLAAAQTGPAEIDHVLLTHLHPDHAGGLIYPDGLAVFPHAAVHVAKADADHWLDPARAGAATGVPRLVHNTAARAVAPYRDTGRFLTFGDADEAIPGVRTVNLAGHSAGHTGYLFDQGEETVLFWGDTVHCHSVQLRSPSVATGTDSEAAAVGARRTAFNSHRRTDGGSGAPICRSRVWGIFAATQTATRGCRSPTHPSSEVHGRRVK